MIVDETYKNGDFDRIIRPKSGLIPIDFKELWHYHELFWFLSWREIVVRYKQTVLGILWAVIQPLLTMVVFTFIFGRLAGFAEGSAVPYAMVTLAGVVPWQFFSDSISRGGQSLVSKSHLITKVYFPRLIIPVTCVISAAIDSGIALAILIFMMAVCRIKPTITFLCSPAFFLLVALVSLTVGLWLSAMNVKYRDFNFIIPFIVRLGIYISPVGFASARIPSEYRFLYSLNPMVGAIDGFRWCILGPAFEPYWPGFWVSMIIALLLLVGAAYYFRRVEKALADII
jgi:lipopolysaccharide transport system permease protein